MKKKTLIVVGILLIVILEVASVLYGKLGDLMYLSDFEESETSDVDELLAPDFVVYDVDGNEVQFSDFEGKPVIINFWATWCGICTEEMPIFEEAYLEYGDQIQFMMINLTDGSQETVESASAYIVDKGYTFPVYYDMLFEAGIQYVSTGIPVTCFIGADGTIKGYRQGAISQSALQNGIDMLLE